MRILGDYPRIQVYSIAVDSTVKPESWADRIIEIITDIERTAKDFRENLEGELTIKQYHETLAKYPNIEWVCYDKVFQVKYLKSGEVREAQRGAETSQQLEQASTVNRVLNVGSPSAPRRRPRNAPPTRKNAVLKSRKPVRPEK
jgi:hypothetical protein